MAVPSYLCKKSFGSCRVKWLIDNFSLQTITKNWLIQSPEFIISGSEETSWLMTLRPILTNESTCVLFSLKRSVTDSGPKYTWLNLKGDCIISGVKYVCFNDTLQSLKNGAEYKVCFGSIESLLSEIKLSDEFTIVCHMIVYNNSPSLAFGECNEEGFKLLSKNMLDLYRSAQHFDTKLVFDDNVILAHKAILCARNEYLSFFLQEDENDDEDVDVYESQECTIINVTDILNYKAMKKILAYLYTGDMRHVLEEPSFAINDCASVLDIGEIETHYKPDELALKSTIDLDEYTYTLLGYKLKKSCLIWHRDAEGTMKTYQLIFYPNKECKNYIKLFTKTSQKALNVRLKLDFVYKRVIVCSEFIVDSEFIDMNEKADKHLKNLNSFDVIINLKVTTGMKITSIDNYSNVSVSCINKDMYYESLSIDMEYLLDGGPFTDALIINNGIFFWVHKCVLASRSRMFSDLLLINEEGEAIHTNFDPHTISVVLTYLYSGSLLDVSDEEVIDVYKAAVLSNLPQLKSMCSEWLEEAFKTNKSVRCRIVRMAEINGDFNLMKSVLNHLFERKDNFSITYLPFSFQDVHACGHCLATS